MKYPSTAIPIGRRAKTYKKNVHLIETAATHPEMRSPIKLQRSAILSPIAF